VKKAKKVYRHPTNPLLPGYVKDMTGVRQPDGDGVVVGPAGLSVTRVGNRQGMYWLVRCGCGAEVRSRGTSLREGHGFRCRACMAAKSWATKHAAGYVSPLAGVPLAERPKAGRCERCRRKCKRAGYRFCSPQCFGRHRAAGGLS
jgi:hypothetical protein